MARDSNDLAWWQKGLAVLGAGALMVLGMNLLSGGTFVPFLASLFEEREPSPTVPRADDVVFDGEPTEDEINRAQPWACFYDPTMNDSWHDDVICWRGTESHRPMLLEGQFVTESDMIAAGDEYEAELNAR